MMVKKIYMAALLVLCLAGGADGAEITADVLTYNGETKVARAEGDVVIHGDEGEVLTGAAGEYRFNDKSAWMNGGVHYTKGATSLAAAEVTLAGDKTLHGTGGVEIHDGENTLTGSTVTYNPDTGYGVVDGNGYISMPDGNVAAPHIEGNLKGIRITATGGVHITSDVHQLDATSDEAVYTKTPNADDGHVTLSGNAAATQNGNTITGPELDIRLNDNFVETKGRSTLVITNTAPQ